MKALIGITGTSMDIDDRGLLAPFPLEYPGTRGYESNIALERA
jgi:hypothetical protein